MKKTLITLLLLIIFISSGCTSNSIKESSSTLPEEYYLTTNNHNIKLNMLINSLTPTIGMYNNVRVEESSYDSSDTNVYEYDYFEIESYKVDNVEKIYSITITSEEQSTNEGIKIGDSVETMQEVYGINYTNPVSNIYIYTISNTNISFITENDIIVLIKYYLT